MPTVKSVALAIEPVKKAMRGFASLSPERRKEVASLGGKTAHAKGVAHKFNSEEGRAAAAKSVAARQWGKL